MRNKKDNFITTLLSLIMVIIFLLTVYFCLDVFGIIQVPSKYSLASLFYSQIEVIASGESITDIILPTNEKKDRIIVRESEETSQTSSDVKSPLYSLNTEENNNNVESTYPSNRFYYNQLDEYGKLLYTGLYKNIDNLKTGTAVTDFGMSFNTLLQEESGNEVLGNALDGAINSLILDNPELFYIDITKMYLLTNITTKLFSTTYKVTISGNGESYLDEAFTSTEEVEKAIAQVEEIKEKVLIEANMGSVEDKVRLVHDYLIDTIDYDLNAGSTVYDIYGALVNRRVVCEGYAKAFKYILDDLGIPCIIVCGTGTNSSGETESHAWNYVQLDGNWYAVDVTWDDPIITGFSIGDLPNDIRYANFLKGSQTFFQNHIEDENMLGKVPLSYPVISQTDF